VARKKSATKLHEHFHKDGSLWARGELKAGVMEGYWEWCSAIHCSLRSLRKRV
jgi:hypothetical protein